MNALLSASDLTLAFGGLKAVNGVSFDVQRGEVFTLIGPNGAGKTTVFNLISRIYQPTSGSLTFDGHDLLQRRARPRCGARASRERSRTSSCSSRRPCSQNLLIGRHTHRQTALWQEILFTPTAWRAERAFRDRVEQVIDFLDLQHYRDTMVAGAALRDPQGRRAGARAVRPSRACCCSTSRRPA